MKDIKNMRLNVQEANDELTAKPLLAASAERFHIYNELKTQYKDLSQPRRFSKILSVLLERVSVPVKSYDLIAGRCVDRLLTESEEKEFAAYLKSKERLENRIIFSSGHCTYSWEMIVEEGLSGMCKKAQENLEKCENSDKRDFFTAMIEIYHAIEGYMLRYADVAEHMGLEEMATNLRIAAVKPNSFYSALQFLWIITLIDCAYITKNPTLTVGRLDKILYPYYKADVEKGLLTREQATEYILDYYCKHNLIMGRGEHQVGDEKNSTTFERIFNFDAPQYLLLAGTDEHKQPVVNELTELFVECIQPSFKNPVIVVRYFNNMNTQYPKLWAVLMEKSIQSASLMFYHDDRVIKTYERIGIPFEDCWNYAHFGCNWCSGGHNHLWMRVGQNSKHFGAYLSEQERKGLAVWKMRVNTDCGWPEDFMIVMRMLAKREPDSVTMEDFYQLFFERMEYFIEEKLKFLSKELEVRKRRPAVTLNYSDCFLEESLSNGESYSAGAKYHFELQSFYSFATVVDCFIAIDQLVMREKKMTLEQLLEAVDANFVGYENILALCRNADKYGMDTPLSNLHAKCLSETASSLVIEKNKPYLEKQRLYLIPCMQSDTWHLLYGEKFGATPDGRLAHMTFSQNSHPSKGSCVNGMTAMFNSLLQLPYDGLVSGALNLDIDRREYDTEEGRKIFGALMGSYFNQGGLHAQISSSSVEELIDAQKNPDAHRDLRVRVTGYSGVFVDICKRLQDDIIERFE